MINEVIKKLEEDTLDVLKNFSESGDAEADAKNAVSTICRALKCVGLHLVADEFKRILSIHFKKL